MSKNFDVKELFVGIDISKDTFDVTAIDIHRNKVFYSNFPMDKNGFIALSRKLAESGFSKKSVQITIESTGIYYLNLFRYLTSNNFDVFVINPLLIHNFHKSMTLRKTKTDKKDSYIIALYTNKNLEKITNRKRQPSSIKIICRERDKLSEEIAKVKTEIKSLLSVAFPELESLLDIYSISALKILKQIGAANSIAKCSEKKLQKIIETTKGNKLKISAIDLLQHAKNSIGYGDKFINKALSVMISRLQTYQKLSSDLDKEIEDYVSKHYSSDQEILTSIKGVGKITSEKFLIEVENIFNFENYKQLTAFAGTDPSIKQSGTSVNVHGRITKKGNKYLRKTLYQMAKSTITYSQRMNDYYHKKRNEKKKYKQAIIAVANKLIRIIFTLLTKRERYVEV